jgi:hypothetical protein
MNSMSCSTTYPEAQTHPNIIAMTASKEPHRNLSVFWSLLKPQEVACCVLVGARC